MGMRQPPVVRALPPPVRRAPTPHMYAVMPSPAIHMTSKEMGKQTRSTCATWCANPAHAVAEVLLWMFVIIILLFADASTSELSSSVETKRYHGNNLPVPLQSRLFQGLASNAHRFIDANHA